MNLAVTVDDIEEGMTHIIRAKDHIDNAKRQKMLYKALGKEKKYPWIGFLGRYKFKDMDLSTTKMRQAIEEGKPFEVVVLALIIRGGMGGQETME